LVGGLLLQLVLPPSVKALGGFLICSQSKAGYNLLVTNHMKD